MRKESVARNRDATARGFERHVAIWVAAGALGACQSQPEPSAAVPSGEWRSIESASLSFRARPGDPRLCDGFVKELERFVGAVRATLPDSRVGSRRVTVYQFSNQADFDASAGCGEPPGALEGCAKATTAYGAPTATLHEIAHALLSPLGNPPRFFSEGAASALGCSPFPDFLLTPPVDWRPLLSSRDGTVVPMASRFVTGLIDRYGAESFTDFYSSLPREAPEARVSDEFFRVYAETLDEAWARFRAEPTTRTCLAVQACSAPELGETEVALVASCDGRLGALLPEGALELDFGAPGFAFKSCSAFGYSQEAALHVAEGPSWFWSKERYGVIAPRRTDDVAPETTISAHRLPGVLTDSCESAQPIPLDPATPFWRHAFVGTSDRPLYLAFDSSDAVRLEVGATRDVRDVSKVKLCRSCVGGAANDCQAPTALAQGRFWLEVRANELEAGDFLELVLASSF